MTTVHDEYLELAAAAIDFELSPSEKAALAAHLADCVPCRRRVAGLQADGRSIAQMTPFVMAPSALDVVRARVHRGGRSTRPTLRLLALAAMLALLAIGTFTVGAEVLRRDRDRDLTLVPPSVNPTQSPAPAPTPRQGVLLAGSVVDVVVTGLRVRTAPTVDDTKSAKLEPLLSIGTRLEVIDGPVTADDYDWYLVQAIGLPHRGWVAAADHDGSPWVEDRVAEASATPTYSPDEAALVAGLRPDAAVACAPRRAALPARATTGVECRVDAGIVERVGAYLFGDARDAALTYLERLAAYGIRPASGDCPAGTGGDAAWMPGDGLAGSPADQVSFGGSSRLVVGRSGCFLDENGSANVRLTCGAVYVGILGRNGGLADLHRWAWQSPDGPVESGEAPGICGSGA